ncbi:extracellular solute-binding protein [Exiguobacterium profundum]|uniref:extracellular solute-binding protein n=1 Tax=Exiguobacterium profundum TaxID=307643 RepID=UPI003517FC41
MEMKKLVAGLSVSVMAIGALAACGGGTDSDSSSNTSGDGGKPDKIVIWEDTEKAETTKAAAKAFEEKEGVKVEVKEVKMTDQQKKVALDGPADKGPDIILLPHDQIGTVVDQGLITELKDGEKALEPFIDTAKSAVTFDGKVYGYPKAVETPILLFNKDELKEAPASMDDLYKVSTEQKKDGKYGFLALWDNFYFAHGVVAGFGGYVFKEDGGALDPADIGLNNEGAVEGFEYIGKWYEEGLFPKGLIGESGGQAMDQLFTEKKAHSVMNGPWAVAGYTDAGVNLGAAPMPTLPNGEPIKTFMGVKTYALSAYTENQEWAEMFLQELTNEENALAMFEAYNEIPPVAALESNETITSNEVAKAVFDQATNAIPMPNIPEMGQVWEPMAQALQLVATGKQDAQKSADDAVKVIEQQIQANNQ